MCKNITISWDMFLGVIRALELLERCEIDTDARKQVKALRGAVEEKIEALAKRDLYTAYKTTVNPVEREAARQKYLDMAGIPASFRWTEGEPGE